MSHQQKVNPHRKNVEIVGLISSSAYQRAKLCAETISKFYPRIYLKPKLRGMLEFDWDEYLTKQRRTFGGKFWSLVRPVVVYVDGKLIGSDEEFVKRVKRKCVLHLRTRECEYRDIVRADYARCLVKSKRLHVYLDIWMDRKHLGRLVFQLYSDLLPDTCRNFRCLCTGEHLSPDSKPLSYRGTEIHRVCKTGWIQGGDIEHVTGGGGASIYGATFPDESYCVSHERRGVLSMANDGKHTNASQFFVTLQPTLWMDRYYVAFGQLVEGVEVLKAIENVDTFFERPQERIHIENCGVLFDPDTLMPDNLKQKHAEEEKKDEIMMSSLIIATEGEELPKMSANGGVADELDVDSDLNLARYQQGMYYLDVEQAGEEEEDSVEAEVRLLLERVLSEAAISPLDEADIAYLLERVVSASVVSPMDANDIYYLVESIIAALLMNSENEVSIIVEEIMNKVEKDVLERAIE